MIVCNKNLNELGQLFQNTFERFPNKKQKSKKSQQLAFSKNFLQKMVWINSKKQRHILTLLFPIKRSLIRSFDSLEKSQMFVKRLLENAQDDSFVNALYKRNWIFDFTGGHFWADPDEEILLQTKFFLSNEGLENVSAIVSLFFQEIKMIEESMEQNEEDMKSLHK